MSLALVKEDPEARKDAAFDLIERGFFVLPVKAGEKRPDPLLAPDGFKGATRDYMRAGDWWSVKPRANIGIACGEKYGFVILDVDVKGQHNGVETLAGLGIDYATLTADTPSGGFHLYFKHPGKPLPATLPGIDIKGANGGGYVLAPPSTLPNGSYTWRDQEMPVREFPEQLLAKPPMKATAKTGPVAQLMVPEGQRHSRLIELGAVFRGKGLAPDEIETLLWDHAGRYFDPAFSRDNPAHVREIEAVVNWYGTKTAPEAASALKILGCAELITRADEVPDRMLLDPILPEAGNLMIYGPAGSGKSHLGLCVALALTRKGALLDWHAPEPMPVLFVDGEMPLPELRDRLVQYLAGAEPPDNLHWAAARAQDGDMPDLADPEAQARYLEAVQTTGARVIVFDNLSCLRITTADMPENSAEAWQPVGAFLRRLNRLGVATVTVHHAAKSGTQRGSSAHTAVMDVVLRVTQPGEGQADPNAELDCEIYFEKHRRFGGDAAKPIRAKVIGDADGFATWQLAGDDPLAADAARLHLQGKSQAEIAKTLGRSRRGVQKALERAKARGLVPLK